jgi:putative membrane-bound dehydrogenase-like protein
MLLTPRHYSALFALAKFSLPLHAPRTHMKQALAFLFCGAISTLSGGSAEIAMPKVNDPELRLQLFAAEPNIVTPTGIAIDPRHRVFVIECHTHFPKKDYPGPKTDRVKMFLDSDNDGDFDTVKVFAEGFHSSMSLALSPKEELYLVHRNGIVILRDTNDDGVCDQQKSIVEMDTKGNYPHNGLGGIAFSPDGWLYLGTGENLGEKYTLKGSDGSSHSGGGEGGNVFRCKPDGSQLQHIATGFWNAFGLGFNSAGHLFCVDNDPDSRPPCRLIDVVEGGDYGYRFRYGRSGLHPFSAWNGELPGTLPMVAGTGEAPSGVLDTRRAALPAKYDGGLLVSSWGDYRVEFYPLVVKGASLTAERQVIVQGTDMFRPVAFASAPDGSVYFTDWVDRDYSVHGKGRIWKLSPADATFRPKTLPVRPSPARRRMLDLLKIDSPKRFARLTEALRDDDPFIRSAAVTTLARPIFRGQILDAIAAKDARVRLGALLALRRAQYTNATAILEPALVDADHDVRLAAVIWAGEAKLDQVRSALSKTLSAGPNSPALVRAWSTALEQLSKPTTSSPKTGSEVVVFPLTDPRQRQSPFTLEGFPARLKQPPGSIPSSDAEWRKALAKAGNPEAGRRVFFDPTVGCAQCHRIEDYGGALGPDLSVVGRVANRDRIIDSILDPSKEVAPQFVQHTVETKSGDSFAGILTGQQSDGTIALLMNDGRGVLIPGAQVAEHQTSKVSLMPDDLEQGLSVEEFRDLLAFLLFLK